MHACIHVYTYIETHVTHTMELAEIHISSWTYYNIMCFSRLKIYVSLDYVKDASNSNLILTITHK